MNAGVSLRMVSVATSVCAHTVPPLVATATAVCSVCVLPFKSSSCRRAAAMLSGLEMIWFSNASTWSAPTTKAPGAKSLTASALARARTSATSWGSSAFSPLIAWRMVVSSSPGASVPNASPAPSRRLALVLLVDANISGGRPACRNPIMPTPSCFQRPRFAVVIKADDGRGRLLDGAPCHVDDRPAMPGAELPRLGDLRGNRVPVHIFLKMPVRLLDDAVLAHLGDSLRARHQRHHEGAGRLFQLGRQRHAGHERYIGGFKAAIGEIDAGRGLRGAADAENNHVGVVEVLRQMSVVVDHGKVQCLDTAEIIGIAHVLSADHRRRRHAEIGFEHLQHMFQRRHVGNVELLAG